jgi:hypothetical protein
LFKGFGVSRRATWGSYLESYDIVKKLGEVAMKANDLVTNSRSLVWAPLWQFRG